MNLFNVLETAIGLSLIFLMLSVLCSAINEWIAHKTRRRGQFLREGLLNLLPDKWLYLRLINHPLIATYFRNQSGRRQLPSYLPPASVATALLDVIVKKAEQIDSSFKANNTTAPEFAQIREAALKCKEYGYTFADAILLLLDQADNDLEAAKKAIVEWYDSTMDRVSGWYKSSARKFMFLIGLTVAVLLNVDTIEITKQLMSSDALRQTLVETALHVTESGEIGDLRIIKDGQPVELTPDDIKQLSEKFIELEAQGLPIGFSCLAPGLKNDADIDLRAITHGCWDGVKQSLGDGNWLMKLIGWLITALAISLGGPFWFDLLNRLVNLRSAGKQPAPSKPAGAA